MGRAQCGIERTIVLGGHAVAVGIGDGKGFEIGAEDTGIQGIELPTAIVRKAHGAAERAAAGAGEVETERRRFAAELEARAGAAAGVARAHTAFDAIQ